MIILFSFQFLQHNALKKKTHLSSLDLIPFLASGKFSVSMNSFPLLNVDCSSKAVEVEMRGVHESGIQLFHIMKTQRRLSNVVRNAQELAGKLHQLGWQLTLYSMGSAILTMGRGAPRLTGHISASPFKLRRIIKDLLL